MSVAQAPRGAGVRACALPGNVEKEVVKDRISCVLRVIRRKHPGFRGDRENISISPMV